MKPGPILFAVSTVALAVMLAPYLPVSVPDGGEAQGHAVTPPPPSRQQAWTGHETVLERQPDGHFYAEAAIGPRSARFLVDTGASIVALTGDDASAIGLQWDKSQVVPIGQGASGVVNGVPVQLDVIELDGFSAENVSAAIVPEGLGVSLLGQSFLSRLETVKIEGDRMILGS